MDFGKLPEHIYERSVHKVIHTTEYQKITGGRLRHFAR